MKEITFSAGNLSLTGDLYGIALNASGRRLQLPIDQLTDLHYITTRMLDHYNEVNRERELAEHRVALRQLRDIHLQSMQMHQERLTMHEEEVKMHQARVQMQNGITPDPIL